MKETIKVALAGNPNVGKSVIFNALTGARQKVGNWPGVTVEKKEGICEHKGVKMTIVDLPGIYSLSATSIDEKIARDFILNEKPDVVVDIVDASNIERNLYLTLQLIEMGANVVVALNKMDLAKSRGYRIDVRRLSAELGVPVVPMVAIRGEGIKELKNTIIHAAHAPRKPVIKYDDRIEKYIEFLESKISENSNILDYPTRFIAIKLLELDEEIMRKVGVSKEVAREWISSVS